MKLKEITKKLLVQLPFIKKLKLELQSYKSILAVPPGHYYSPILNYQEIADHKNEIFNLKKPVRGINNNDREQFELLTEFEAYYPLIPFAKEFEDGNRYFYNNPYYSYSDVIFLFFIIMHFKPQRIIEIGSGFSSAAMLDINNRFFNNNIDITFIEPFPDILKERVIQSDKFVLIEKKVQDVDPDIFKSLQENDILFIDSSHVAKTHSDVLHEIFDILPILNKGVKIHIHDIFYPFEYPEKWVVDDKKNWNEIYFIRSFLMYNSSFKIILFNTYLESNYNDWFKEHMPLCLQNPGGSLWLEKM